MVTLTELMNHKFQERFDPDSTLIKSGYLPLLAALRLDDHQGCFHTGTKIALANGDEKTIEELTPARPGLPEECHALLSIDGCLTYVVAISVGPQPVGWQLVKVAAQVIGADIKHSVTVTKNHAFARGQVGVIQAQFLRPGDIVQSIYGESAITSVVPDEDAGQSVWNLYSASHEFVSNTMPIFGDNPAKLYEYLCKQMRGSWLGLPPRSHMIFGGGFLTGDLSIQLQLDELHRKGRDFAEFV